MGSNMLERAEFISIRVTFSNGLTATHCTRAALWSTIQSLIPNWE